MQNLNDKEGPAWWLNEHAPALILYARQWVSSHADAEDVFHNAFIQFWKRRECVSQPLPFLYSCVRTAALNWNRANIRRSKHEQNVREQPLFQYDESQMEDSESDALLENALNDLPGEQREVLVMRIWGELSFPQIGEILRIPSSTADTRYRSVIKQLHSRLEKGLIR